MGDRDDVLSFEISKIQAAVDDARDCNVKNRENREKLSSYIDNNLVGMWTTKGGQDAIEKLKEFMANNYEAYVNTIDETCNNIEATIPYLHKIDEA